MKDPKQLYKQYTNIIKKNNPNSPIPDYKTWYRTIYVGSTKKEPIADVRDDIDKEIDAILGSLEVEPTTKDIKKQIDSENQIQQNEKQIQQKDNSMNNKQSIPDGYMSYSQIMEKYGIAQTPFYKYLREHNIKPDIKKGNMRLLTLDRAEQLAKDMLNSKKRTNKKKPKNFVDVFKNKEQTKTEPAATGSTSIGSTLQKSQEEPIIQKEPTQKISSAPTGSTPQEPQRTGSTCDKCKLLDKALSILSDLVLEIKSIE